MCSIGTKERIGTRWMVNKEHLITHSIHIYEKGLGPCNLNGTPSKKATHWLNMAEEQGKAGSNMISIDELFAADDWEKFDEESQLVKFWRHIREASISDDRLLTFKEPFPFGECRGGLASTLYIRDSYEKLWKMIWEHERAVKFLVTGSPGTGKTLFLRYVMYRLAFEKVPIILQMGTNTSNLFLGENVYRCKGYPDHSGILSCKDAWYVVDSLEIPDVAAHSLMVSSPEVQKFKQYRNYRLFQEYYMPTWSLEELLTVGARLWSLSEQEIKERFYFAGGIPRHICEDWTLYKKLVPQIIAILTLENLPRGTNYS